MAVQGGLLASVLAAHLKEEHSLKRNFIHSSLPTIAFLLTKLIAYTTLGFLLGLLGQTISISDSTRIILQLIAGVYMIIIALDLLNVHPIFKYAVIQPPRFLTRMVHKQSKSRDIFAPAFLGFMTIFIPCGTTLAMEALAIYSGSPIFGAAIMGVFTLGTMPLFFGLGFLTSTLTERFRANFLKVAGVVVIYLGVISINGSLVAAGSPLTLQNLALNSPIQIDFSGGQTDMEASQLSGVLVNGVQVVDIEVKSNGYFPSRLVVKKDLPVRLNLKSNGAFSCASAFRIPSLGIVKNLKPKDNASVEFTPVSSGKIAFSCSMGMYTGVIEVI
jgi:sulfite exporter TauE/SafE